MELCVVRTSMKEPCGTGREAFYEQRLLFGLPWHCERAPENEEKDGKFVTRWSFITEAPNTPEHLGRFSMTDRHLDNENTWEAMCRDFGNAYASFACPCCTRSDCATCRHALGWHYCESGPEEQVWCKGTLDNGALDVSGSLWALARR